jgi:cytochrome P450
VTSEFQFDPLDPAVMNDPGPAYSELRERCPFYHYAGPDYDFHITSDYAEIKNQILKSSPVWSFKFGNAAKDSMSDVGFVTDPPFHEQFRALFAPGLSPKAVENYSVRIEAMANELIDAMLQRGRADLHDDFAMPMPVRVMCMVLGAPQEFAKQYKHWGDTLQALIFHDPEPGSYAKLLPEIFAHFDGLVQQRRDLLAAAGIAEPSAEHVGTVLPDDYLSRAVVARLEERALTQAEIRNVCLAFLTGGQETTTALIANCVWRLLQNRALWEQVCANPALIDIAVEESLRFDPPALAHFRTALCPVQMHGAEIPEHGKLMMSFVGANRDPKIFENPDEFRLDRPLAQTRQHLSFGFGTHFCLGSALARLEAKIALRLLTQRLPQLRLDGPTERVVPFMYWGRSKLPVAWD